MSATGGGEQAPPTSMESKPLHGYAETLGRFRLITFLDPHLSKCFILDKDK